MNLAGPRYEAAQQGFGATRGTGDERPAPRQHPLQDAVFCRGGHHRPVVLHGVAFVPPEQERPHHQNQGRPGQHERCRLARAGPVAQGQPLQPPHLHQLVRGDGQRRPRRAIPADQSLAAHRLPALAAAEIPGRFRRARRGGCRGPDGRHERAHVAPPAPPRRLARTAPRRQLRRRRAAALGQRSDADAGDRRPGPGPQRPVRRRLRGAPQAGRGGADRETQRPVSSRSDVRHLAGGRAARVLPDRDGPLSARQRAPAHADHARRAGQRRGRVPR